MSQRCKVFVHALKKLVALIFFRLILKHINYLINAFIRQLDLKCNLITCTLM